MQIMRALDNRNYRFYFIGQSLSLLGNWIQFVAISWLVYRLTSSAFMLGAISFITQIPSLFISPFSGLLADRLNKRRIVITTQALSMLQSGILAVLVLEGQITMEYLFGLGLFSGCVGAVETPSRYAFLVEMVDDPKKIQNVVALNSLLLNVARIIGPVIGGFVIAAIGEGMCFIPIIGLLFAIHVQKTDIIANQKKYLIADIKEGFMYAYRFLPIKYMLSLLTIISLCSVSYLILMPVFAVTTFNSGADTLGYLTSAIGIGAISGSIYLAKRSAASGLQHIIPIAAGLMGISLMLFSCIEKLIPGLIALFFAGMGMVLFTAATNTLIQTLVQDEKRGRIMSLYSMIMMGLTSVGYLGAGALAQYFGAAGVVFGGGIAAFAGAIFFVYKLSLMPKKSFGGV